MRTMSRDEIVGIVRTIIESEIEEGVDPLLEQLSAEFDSPDVSDVIFGDSSNDPESIADRLYALFPRRAPANEAR
jgi:hypothetical protein